MGKKSVSAFLDFVTSKVGCYYWFGTVGQMASAALLADRRKAYPDMYKATDYAKQIANPKQCFDCAGLVKSMWVYPKYNAADDLGATSIYNKCSVKGKLTNVNQLKNGYCIFKGNDSKKTHIAVYKDGKVYEAKGHAYGVTSGTFKLSDWQYWDEYYNVDYSTAPAPTPTPTPEPETGDYIVCVRDFLAERIDPDVNSKKIGELYNGAVVTVLETSGTWARITGDVWVSLNYLKKK